MSVVLNTVTLSVFREQWQPGSVYIHRGGHGAAWLQTGALSCNDKPLDEGCGIYLAEGTRLDQRGSDPAVVIRFGFNDSAHTGNNRDSIDRTLVLSCNFKAPGPSAVMRLDQVDFPPAAIAYRHTHPGAGIRYLVSGGLHVDGEHGADDMTPGKAWFEEANAPVKATAVDRISTRFVRLMLLPEEYLGRPTLTLINKADATRPRLQTNTRHFDQRVDTRNGHG